MIGPTFYDEIAAAGLAGLPFTWGPDGVIEGRQNLTAAQNATLDAVIAAHDPTKPPRLPILAQDLIKQLTPDDFTKIKAAVDASVDFWSLWSSLLGQVDPMLTTDARFMAGWNALVQVLGRPRMNAIATTLGATSLVV